MTAPTVDPVTKPMEWLEELVQHEVPCDRAALRVYRGDFAEHTAAKWRLTAAPCGTAGHVVVSAVVCEPCAAVVREWIADPAKYQCARCFRVNTHADLFTLKEL